jgi:hypothetical protein
MQVIKRGGFMATGQATAQAPAGNHDWKRRPAGLTFGQRALLVMGIAALGYPGLICLEGSVRTPPPQTYSSGQAAVMSNTDPAHLEACVAPASKFDPKPTMLIQNKGKE